MPKTPTADPSSNIAWSSPIPQERWFGFRQVHRGSDAFQSLENFEQAQLSELEHSLTDQEREALGRLLARGKKDEIEVFLRTHGANPISDPQAKINVNIYVAKADVVNLENDASAEANAAILNGDIVYVLFQAGEASRFNRGPLYKLNPLDVARDLANELKLSVDINSIEEARKKLPKDVGDFLAEGPLGPKQLVMIRAGIRRVIQDEIKAGRLSPEAAAEKYKDALQKQKILFFVGTQGNVHQFHEETLCKTYKFYGFNPENIVTVEQELVHGMMTTEQGDVQLVKDEAAQDAAGHLYAFLQAVREGGFKTYFGDGSVTTPSSQDALTYLESRGGKILSIVRINDMDRHSTEIVNAKALDYTLKKFKEGYVNVIECVANTSGQKGGTGVAFDDPEVHVLTETHENSYPALSRAMDAAMEKYLEENKGRHPAYNAMRQWATLSQTRQVLKNFGARIVFVPRQKKKGEEMISYLGVDMPMGDLSLFVGHYRSRMFQFAGPGNRELLIHDMKKKENLPIALRTIANQLTDPFAIAATKELLTGANEPFDSSLPSGALYGAPTPEFDA